MRPSGGALEALLFGGAVVLIGIGVATLVGQARRTGRFGKLGRIGLLCAVLGLALVAVAMPGRRGARVATACRQGA
jgi:hypothetical protein